MRKETRIHLEPEHKKNIANALEISDQISVPIAPVHRSIFGLHRFDPRDRDVQRLFANEHATDGIPYVCRMAGYSEAMLQATYERLMATEQALESRLKKPERFTNSTTSHATVRADAEHRMHIVLEAKNILGYALWKVEVHDMTEGVMTSKTIS